MRFIKPLNEKKPKGAPEFHHSDAPDAEGRFKDLGIKDLAAWLIKTRKKDVKKISGSLTQQIVFNRGDDPKYAEKMEKVRKEVYKQLGRQDLIDKMDESLQKPLYNSFFLLEFQKWVYKNRAKINRMSKDEKIKYLEDNYIKKYGKTHLGSEDLKGVGSDIYHSMVLDNIIKESVDMYYLDNAKEQLSNPHTILDITYDKTRRGDKFVRFDYENKYVPGKMLDTGPHFVKVFYDNNRDLKKISKELGMDLKESVLNEEDTWNDYPAAAKKNAQKAIDWKEKYGRDEVDAGTPVGWARAHQLAKGENLSTDTVKRMSAFNRHRKNSSIKPELKETPWKDRGYVAWLIWGGDEGVDWAIEKSKEIDAMKESKQMKYIKPISEAKMPKKYIGNDEIVYLKTKEDSRGANYNLYYKGHDIDKGGYRFGSEKELEDFAANYILSNQLYKKLRYEDSIPLPEAFVGPFVFNDKMSDDELKAMYSGALDGYSYYAKGMQYPKSDYKKAYQEIEKILKKRGVNLNEAKLSKIHNAAKKGSYPVTLVVIENGKVVKQELVGTPQIVPAAFNQLKKEYPKATVHVESKTGERLFSESVVTEAFKFGKKNQYSIDDVNESYGFWGTLEVAGFKRREIEDNWHSAMAWLTENYRFSDAGALYYLNAKAGRWIADQVIEQKDNKDVVDVLEDYATDAEWKKWSKEYNRYAQEEMMQEEMNESKFSPLGYAKRVISGEITLKDAMKEAGISLNNISKLIKKLDKSFDIDTAIMAEGIKSKYIKTLNEYYCKREHDNFEKEFGKIKYPKWIKVKMKELVDGQFIDKLYAKPHNYMSLWLNQMGKRKFDTDERKKELGEVGYKLTDRYWHDLTGHTAFRLEAAQSAMEVSKHIQDMVANNEEVEPAYYLMKNYFNSFGMDTSRSRIFNMAVEILEEWMTANAIETL
jgi:hypothetical protein